MISRIAAALLALSLLAATIHGVLTNGLLQQRVWEPVGIQRFLIVAAGYVLASLLLLLIRPRWFLPSLGGLLLLYTMAAIGPLAPLAFFYLMASCYAFGAIWFQANPDFRARSPQLLTITGLAVWICFVALTARWPIHYRALYWLLPLIPLALAIHRRSFPRIQLPQTRRELAPIALVLFPLVCHWLISLKPEVSADGLAMHMVIPSRMVFAHAWPFDVQEFTWAVMPMGGDWAFSVAWQLAGESCARLLNPTLVALLAWILYQRLRPIVPTWIAATLTAAFAATPLTQHVTGSLFVENVVASLIVCSALLLLESDDPDRTLVLAGCFLAGVAIASKFGAFAFVVPILIAAATRMKWRRLLPGLVLLLAAGSIPYVEAFLRTGNPFFPFFNAVFRSPLYDIAENFRDARYETPLSWHTLYDLTFHTEHFIEGMDGSFGFCYFLLLPVALLGIRRRWPRAALALFWVAAAGSLITFRGQTNLRYLYPAMPLFTLAIGLSIHTLSEGSRWLERSLGALAVVALLLNFAFLPASGWYHKEFALNQVFNHQQLEDYIGASAPERRLVDWLNTHDPRSRVAFLESNAVANFTGRPFTNTWHSDVFHRRLRESTSPQDHARLAEDLQIQYFIAPAADSWRAITNVYTRQFLNQYTTLVTRYSDIDLRRWKPASAPVETKPTFAPPGEHDEAVSFVDFTGPWTRDMQFAQAFRSSLVYTSHPESHLVIRFQGTRIRLRYTAAANRCQGQITIDQAPPILFDEFSRQTRWQAFTPVFSAPPGEHRLDLRIAPSNPARPGCYLDLDGFTIE
jgi:hypothetical protein